ncbi:MAG: DUF1501 domain-containing protein [Planctomycetota bacterium]|nr:DUF1501 domain-containing protein [Planctomycetota bacterium]
MLNINESEYRLCDGVPRREAMRIGGLGAIGLSLPQLIQNRMTQAASGSGLAFGKAKSVILFWLSGGPPQHETWDPKPDAPAEIRGEFGAISTRTPGYFVGELMPKTAQLTDRIAVMRAVVSGDNNHSSSGYQMLTGIPHVPLSQENAISKAPNLWPSLGAIVRTQRPDRGGLPAAITLPRHIANVGEIVWPGQDGGFLGRKYSPWLLTCDPSAADFSIPDLTLADGSSTARLSRRRSLLSQFESTVQHLDRQRSVNQFDNSTDQAFDLLTGSGARQAFNISEESDATRDRYGRNKFGQSVLLSRRLVEAGVSLVQVNWQQIEGKANNGSWDTHAKHCECLKDFLMPMMDQTYSALIEDLNERGMLDDTLVAWVGEFGHTPKINAKAGRDHWGSVFSCALAGAGIQGGVVHGESDGHAAYPVSGRVAPRDIAATIFHCLGHSPESIMHDQAGRPMPITRGHVIDAVL